MVHCSRRLARRDRGWAALVSEYEQPPATVREFVESPVYLGLKGTVYPKVVDTLEAIFGDDAAADGCQEAALCWGIGSGKSYLAALAICYMVYRTLCLRDPQRSLGLAPGNQITFVNMAPTARQAEGIVYGEIHRCISRSPWFQRHFQPENRGSSELRLPKGIRILPGNSTEAFALGFNILGAVIDEACWFDDEAVESIHRGLVQRIRSRFGQKGLLIAISSPRHIEDFMERRLREGGRALVSRMASWEVRPERLYSGRKFSWGGVEVPEEYREDFERDPVRAMRDFGARPMQGSEGYLPDLSLLDKACDEAMREPWDALEGLAEWFRCEDGAQRFIHVDLGLKRDACGIAMASCIVEGAEPVARVEFMLQIKPPPGGEVDLARVREIILCLRGRGFGIAQVSFDGFESADSRQILRRHGLATRLVSVDRDAGAYNTLRELLMSGRLRAYRYEPFFSEMRALRVRDNGKVDHPPGGSKDVADAVAGAVSEAVKRWGGGGVGGRVV